MFLIQLVASIIFVSLGVITSFFCAIVDGVIAAKFIVSSCLSMLVDQALHIFLHLFLHGPATIIEINSQLEAEGGKKKILFCWRRSPLV